MLSLSEVRKIYSEMSSSSPGDLSQSVEDRYNLITEYFTSKFQETSPMFTKFDCQAMVQFCKNSEYLTYEENQEIFKKGAECQDYYFLIYGDINLYDEEFSSTQSNKLLKTLSAGSVYGHKIKANFNYFAVAKNSVQMVKINKKKFDNLLEETNKRKEEFKTNFLKKFFPKFRMYSDDLIKSLKTYFIREQYEKNAKIIVDNEFDEYVYIVIKGNLSIAKSLKRIKNLRETLIELNYPGVENIKSVLLEKLTRGDIFGVYSALKHQKNNYTVTVLSEKAEVYKISKSHCLFYFGGSSGVIPEALKGIDSVQQVSLSYKLDFLERCKNPNMLQKFTFIQNEGLSDKSDKKPIDESEITNIIKDSWKDLENLGSKISDFKNSLLKPGLKSGNTADIFAKLKTENDTEMKDHTKIMGFATNRVVSKTLNKTGLSAVQMKGMSTLQGICGVKKAEVDQNALLKITALKNLEGHKKSKLLSDLDDLPAKDEKNNSENQNLSEKAKKATEEEPAGFSKESLRAMQANNQLEEKDNISVSSISTSSTNGSVNSNSIIQNNQTSTDGTSASAAPQKKPGFSLKNLI